jgi:hypothetical protein
MKPERIAGYTGPTRLQKCKYASSVKFLDRTQQFVRLEVIRLSMSKEFFKSPKQVR